MEAYTRERLAILQAAHYEWEDREDCMTVITVGGYHFQCDTPIERYRAETLFTKEEGTVRWLLDQCSPSDVLYDIGANIGLYTVVAARRGTYVYAFEPHQANAAHLADNVRLNIVAKLVAVLTQPLHSEAGERLFHYMSEEAGSSGSQLGHTISETGKVFQPVTSRVVHTTTIDHLVKARKIRPATLVKLDVDGNELDILRGMTKLLWETPPRQIQVEMHPKDDLEIVSLLFTYDYDVVERHYTTIGKERLAKGVDPALITHNAIFKHRGKIVA